MNDQARNLNPHRPAVAAMWLWGNRYSQQAGGSMDFWDKLSESEQKTARRLVEQILSARAEGEIYLIDQPNGAWVTTAARWSTLHHVPAWDFGEDTVAVAACGLSTTFAYPGVISRLGMKRCSRCCKSVGIASGFGTPENEAALREGA